MDPNPLSIVNHIFVDFENVQKIDPAVIGGKNFRLTLLAGPLIKKVDLDLFEESLNHPGSVQLVRLTSSGRNALDFALAYYVGRAAVAADPAACFHIVTKDTGFNPLVEHLRRKEIKAYRHDSFDSFNVLQPMKWKVAYPIPARAKPKAKAKAKVATTSLNELASKALEHLRKTTTKPPKNLSKLVSHLGTHLGKKITAAEVPGLVESLKNDGYLTINDKGEVSYHLA